MKTTIINILQHPPPYHLLNEDEKPKYYWKTRNGSFAGTNATEWPDLLGEQVLKLTDKFNYEVWQPDLRADKIFQQQLDNGAIHKLFPAQKKRVLLGLKPKEMAYSNPIIEELGDRIDKESVILHVNNIINYFIYRILKKFDVPTLIQFHSKTTWPPHEKWRLRKNIFKNLYYYSIEQLLKRRRISIIYSNSLVSENEFKKLAPVSVKRSFMGVDFALFPGEDSKNDDEMIFSMASRFVGLKQIDKVIQVFNKIHEQGHDFKLIIAGHGEEEYEKSLKQTGEKLIDNNKLFFPGYLSRNSLLKLYQKSDLFISASRAEGGPVSVMKALATETPVMCTKVGGVDDILAKHNAGVLVDPFDYSGWKKEIVKILEGKEVPVLDREIAKSHFDWESIARKFIHAYQSLE